ncbi:MAG: TIGR03564 family F420-dependent LLM class oxidoreductase [Acidimicrobiia bacterium]|nr:TIGR03564 family F420-dependent LLM class oxidoreductase [Acidimicrobiia bacterium]
MEIGQFGFIDTVEGITKSLESAASDGFASYWIPQAFGMDTLTVIGAVGPRVPGLRLATAVVPTYPRHPMVLAQQALTTNLLVGGRLALGVGPSHKPVVEGSWGISFDRPIRHLHEYLVALQESLGQKPRYQGETITAKGDLSVPDAPTPKVLVSALGPQLLKLTGSVADGTITWMTGPNTLRDLTVPTITAAADAAGRPAPEVVAGVPVCVTDDPAATLERANRSFSMYGTLPSYRAMLDREGYDGPGEIAIIGDADTVGERILAFADLGVTTFAASEFGSRDQRAATRELLVRLLAR